MKNLHFSTNNTCPFDLFFLFNTNSMLVFILTTTKYNYIGFLTGIDTRLNVLYGKSTAILLGHHFIYKKNYNLLFLNTDKIISITPINNFNL
nr:DNA-directed RNA polymerase 40k chain [Cryptomonas curvata]|mmetsp:Transcript_27332/g.56827  ORF Transcript_27332/g.56827 Transcript_27332/m.56827 type:complete len:92 (+) Transcript_27332:265-540(+)